MITWLYLARRSDLHGAPVLICPWQIPDDINMSWGIIYITLNYEIKTKNIYLNDDYRRQTNRKISNERVLCLSAASNNKIVVMKLIDWGKSSPNQLNPNSNISYLRWLVITPQPARLDILTASILSVTDPIWLTWQNKPQNWISKVSTDEEKQEQCYSECQHYNDTLRRRALQVFSLIAFSTLCTNENRGKRGKKPSSIGGQTST